MPTKLVPKSGNESKTKAGFWTNFDTFPNSVPKNAYKFTIFSSKLYRKSNFTDIPNYGI